jgi:hypothetical protein
MKRSYGGLTAAGLVAALETAGRYPDVDLILHLDERREETEPLLLALFAEALDEEWPDGDPRWYRLIHCGLILLGWRSSAALPLFADLYLNPAEQDTLEWFEVLPAHYGPAAGPPFIRVATASIDMEWHYGRALAIEILKYLAFLYPETREPILTALRGLLPPAEAVYYWPPDRVDEMWGTILSTLAELQDEDSRRQGLALLDAGLVDPFMCSVEYFLDGLRGRYPPDDLKPFELLDWYAEWYEHGQAEQRKPAAKPAPALTPKTRAGSSPGSTIPAAEGAQPFPRAGRNDPCPCGSGKKYKHCHGKPG